MKRRDGAIIIGSIIAVLFLYIGSYCVNSLYGGYWMEPDRDGRDRHSSGLSMTTAILHQPAVGYHTQFGADLVGTIYAPLIRLDRRIFHPTRYLTDENVWAWIESLEIDDIHPSFREEVMTSRLEPRL